MAAFLFATENIVFVSAIVLMLLIGAVQAIGIAGDFDLDIHGDADLLGWLGLGWLGLGRLPLLMLLAIFLALFGMIGLIGQHLLLDFAGAMLSPLIAAPAAFLASLPLTGFAARWLPPLLPRDQSSAVPLDALTGSFARIVTGVARSGSPARARVEDAYGQAHYVMVEPDNAGQTLEEGETILLVRREDHVFRAISHGDHYLPRL
ncbi:OB-fold-containig protein [Sphingobium sp. LMC3-1-1.1]|uniref:OB-fold-containig protein n=1 Tax=unclassified Sphingobium TaxID=2611147 RepID=UPI0034300FA8